MPEVLELTVAVKVAVCLSVMVVELPRIASVVAATPGCDAEAAAAKKFAMSSDPSPVTWSYPVVKA